MKKSYLCTMIMLVVTLELYINFKHKEYEKRK